MAASSHGSPLTDHVPIAKTDRLWEIDALRGCAIVAMMVFHFWWDWSYLQGTPLGSDSRYYSGPIAVTFITLLGLSASLDRDRVRARGGSVVRRTAHRFALIAGAAILVTVATRVALPSIFVYFGILHLLALCTLLVAVTAPLGAKVNAVLGLAVIIIGWSGLLAGPAPETVLSFLGWAAPRATMDWYPFAPWGGFAFLGFALGRSLYPNGRRRLPLPDLGQQTRPLRALGRHALPIYLSHQLVLYPLALLLTHVLP